MELVPVPREMRLAELPHLLASLPRLGVEDAAAFHADLAVARGGLADAAARDPRVS